MNSLELEESELDHILATADYVELEEPQELTSLPHRPPIARRGWHPKRGEEGNCGSGRALARGPPSVFLVQLRALCHLCKDLHLNIFTLHVDNHDRRK